MGSVSVLVADSRRLAAEALANALRIHGIGGVIEEFPCSGLQTWAATSRYKPAVLLIDHWLSGVQGPATSALIKRRFPNTRVIMLGWFHSRDDVVLSLAAGVSRYEARSIKVVELVEIIASATSDDPDQPTGIWARIATLTQREIQTLSYLARSGRYHAAADRQGIKSKTVRTHLSSVLKKTDLKSLGEAVAFARTYGLLEDMRPPVHLSERENGGRLASSAEIRVLVADSQPLFAESLRISLGSEQGLSVMQDEPGSFEELFDVVSCSAPDVVLLDQWLPGRNAAQTIRALRDLSVSTKIIVLSWMHNVDQVRSCLRAGASGFLPKSVTLSKVVVALREASRSDLVIGATELAAFIDRLEPPDIPYNADAFDSLTRRERAVLLQLCMGLTITEIGRSFGISVGTVNVHIRSLLAKTGTRSHPEAVAAAVASGKISIAKRLP